MHPVQARIQWFDAGSGEGMVVTADGESLYLNFTCIDGVEPHNWQWPTALDQDRLRGIEGAPCTVSIYRNLYSARVERCAVALPELGAVSAPA